MNNNNVIGTSNNYLVVGFLCSSYSSLCTIHYIQLLITLSHYIYRYVYAIFMYVYAILMYVYEFNSILCIRFYEYELL